MKQRVVLNLTNGSAVGRKQKVTLKPSPSRKPDIGLTVENDCTCLLMAQHCPIHAVRPVPAPGMDVIR